MFLMQTLKTAEADFASAMASVVSEFYSLGEKAEQALGIGAQVAKRPGHQEESAPGVWVKKSSDTAGE